MLPGQGVKIPGVHAPGKKKRINLVAVLLNVFAPWIVFASLYAAMSFSFRYNHAAEAYALVALGYIFVVVILALAYRAKRVQDRDPSWYLFAAITMFIAVTCSWIFGEMNFKYFMAPYYDIEGLNSYPNVNPAKQKGQQIMDAGRVYFADGAMLDRTKAMAFKNMDMYCVAPIVNGNQQLETYDFWAIGVNCCSGVASDFRCGEYNNPHARAGLRLMRDDLRPYFRLAVQQADAAYNLKSTHPLFFYWMQDPVAHMNTEYRDQGFKYYLLGIFSFFALNLFLVIVAVIGFSRVGPRRAQ